MTIKRPGINDTQASNGLRGMPGPLSLRSGYLVRIELSKTMPNRYFVRGRPDNNPESGASRVTGAGLTPSATRRSWFADSVARPGPALPERWGFSENYAKCTVNDLSKR